MSKEDDKLLPSQKPKTEIATISQDGDGEVTLKLKKGKFEEFIFGFFGKKESLKKAYYNNFVLKLEDILQFHYLLIQKTEKEQFISLSLITTEFLYDDETSRTINTIDALEKYYEYRDVNVISVNMTWNFIFQLPNENNFQQQKISLFFNTREGQSHKSIINVNIEHTNQVWAAEVLRLFEEHINKIENEYSFIYQILLKLKKLDIFGIALVASIIIAFLGMFYMLIQNNNILKPIKQKDELMYDLGKVVSDNASNNENIDIIIQFFLIDELDKKRPDVIRHLRDEGYFNPEYDEIIDKLISEYYSDQKESKELVHTLEAKMKQITAKKNILFVFRYLKYPLVYIFIYIIFSIYLRIFKIISIVAITSKGIKELETQERTKSTKMQIAFGIISSLIAAIIYQSFIYLCLH